jgi:mono/diheme cytochrome c family protein
MLSQKPLLKTLLISAGITTLLSATVIQNSRWVAPKEADNIKNPLAGNAAAVTAGKQLYSQYCVVCHGEKGRGDGVAAAGLNPKPADHTSVQVQSQTDGAIFWKMTNGRAPMAAYSSTLSEQQRWDLVDYIRTLKKPEKGK